MRFGLSILGSAQQPRGEDMQQRFGELLQYVHAARDAGYHHLTTGQHYLLDPLQMLQPVPLLARLIPETGDMRLVATLVMPVQSPVDLAESWATLDVLSGGRVTISAALGYREVEYRAFGIPPAKRAQQFVDVLDTVRALWTGEPVTRRGIGFQLEEAVCTIRPVQQPHPPIWVAANADVAVRRAATMGLDWNINAHATLDTVARQITMYREVAAAHGREQVSFPMARELYCGRTREEAFAIAMPYLAPKYEAYARWGQDKALPEDDGFPEGFAELARDRFIIGAPDDCVAEVERLRLLGVDRLHLRMGWPRMPIAQVLEGMERFASEVIPHFV